MAVGAALLCREWECYRPVNDMGESPGNAGGCAIAMPNDWIPVAPGFHVRMTSNGQWEGVRTQDVSHELQAIGDMRKVVRREGYRKTETKTGSMRHIASLPAIAAAEMNIVCGKDREKQMHWLSQHPEYVSVPMRGANLPKRKIYIY